jgi:hypothetical protein
LNLNPESTAEQREKAMKDDLRFAQDRPIADALHEVRVIVLDRNTNIAGSITLHHDPAARSNRTRRADRDL